MRNYVIINGVNSNTITGLAIKELPPISKPLMRSDIEEIDGRDGDIITELGYSAYDKEMEIGLYGSFNINQVISFFDKEGTITFSDESDKYYKFKVLEQIDFNKLLKFKEATVTFHCQPFKYPVSETPITISGETTVTNNGNIYAMPVLSIVGSGTIGITLNGIQIFSIELGDTSTPITIDTANMEAYNTSNTELMNRQVTGDYSLFKILSGNNTIEITGSISQATISGYMRWL